MVSIEAQSSAGAKNMNHRATTTTTTTTALTTGQLRAIVRSIEGAQQNAIDQYRTSSNLSRVRAIVALSSIFVAILMLSSYRESSALVSPFYDGSTKLDKMTLLQREAFHSYGQNAPLFEAVNSNDVELVRSLLRDGIGIGGGGRMVYYNVNAEDESGITPLILATLIGNVELVNLLLANGARPQPLPGFRHTPLRAACLSGNAELIELLLDAGADPNAMSEGGRTPLMGACYLRPQYDEGPDRIELSFGAVELLLSDPRTDPSVVNEFGESALDLCRERMYNKSMALLRDYVRGGNKIIKKRAKGNKIFDKEGSKLRKGGKGKRKGKK